MYFFDFWLTQVWRLAPVFQAQVTLSLNTCAGNNIRASINLPFAEPEKVGGGVMRVEKAVTVLDVGGQINGFAGKLVNNAVRFLI